MIAIQRNGIVSNNRRQYRSSGNPYNQSGKPAQIEALDEQKLALRLNVNIPTLKEKHATLEQEFEEWSKNRDRVNIRGGLTKKINFTTQLNNGNCPCGFAHKVKFLERTYRGSGLRCRLKDEILSHIR